MNIVRLNSFIGKLQEKPTLFFVLGFILFFGFSIVIRLPHFLSDAFWFDGDEGIVGIMAQDLLTGKNFSLYFYGQNYGFSIVEVTSVALWLKLIGTGIWALRLGGLTLFALGSTFLFQGLLARNVSIKTALLITLAMLFFPPWILWGGMVRGGYLTAFLAISILFSVSSDLKMKLLNYVLIGMLLAIAFESHIFLLLPILPLLLMDWRKKEQSFKALILVLLCSSAFVFIFRKLNFQNNYWDSPALNMDFSLFSERFLTYFKGVLNSFGGFYYYTADIPMPYWWSVVLFILLLSIVGLLIKLFVTLSFSKKTYMLLSVAATVLIFFIALSMKNYTPRYLLSIYTGWFFIYLFFIREALENILIRKLSIFILCLIFLGIFSGNRLRRDWYDTDENRMDEFRSLYQEVKNQNKKAVFICDNLMQWQWNYLYGNEIPANGFRSIERTMDFTVAVDSIYRTNPEQTAIIGYWGLFYGIDFIEGFNDTRKQVETDYFIQPIVNKEFHDRGYLEMGEKYQEKTKE